VPGASGSRPLAGASRRKNLDNAAALLRLWARRFILRADAATFDAPKKGREPLVIAFTAAARKMEVERE
jgi:hypothetical protein